MEIQRCGPVEKPLVSVIIPTKDRQKKLETCLRSVFSQHYEKIEVIVVDNASSDGTLTMIKQSFPNVFHICNSTNRGAAVAKNQGIRVAQGEYVWFLDSDTRVNSAHCLETMVAFMTEHKDIGSLGGELCAISNNRIVCLVKYLLMNGQGETKYFASHEVVLKNCDYCATANCFARTKDIITLGGFDPAYFYLCEDTELGYRLKRMGKRNVCDYRVAVFHDVDPNCQRNYFLRLRNSLRFAIKNLPFYYVIILPFSFLSLKTFTRMIRRIKLSDPGVWKYFPSSGSRKIQYIFFPIKIFVAVAYAYIWNIVFLPKTLLSRLRMRNYINDA